ncbi:MAG: hypothetical protein HND48_24695 [Chloroflexi bacterium]|nr:hypothetical protein [Chloroflexota bacterium]
MVAGLQDTGDPRRPRRHRRTQVPWRTRTYGPEILSVIAKHENGAKS